jgi:uncharacterized membrane protein YtjA (UPF0391 family)
MVFQTRRRYRIESRHDSLESDLANDGIAFATEGVAGFDLNFHEMRNEIMLSWALTFLIIALIAGVLGFGGVAGQAAWIAHVLFVVFLVLFLVSLIAGRRSPPI